MMHTVTAAWVLTMMLGVQPSAPWKDTYSDTAEAIADVANTKPVFAGDDGPAKTASYFVSISWFESNFNPRAEGDCRTKDGVRIDCKKPGAIPHSFCLGQINDTNFESLGVTKEDVLGSTKTCLLGMRAMVAQSLRMCTAAFPADEEQGLAWYTVGGPRCQKNDKSAHRVRKGRWLFAHYPVQ